VPLPDRRQEMEWVAAQILELAHNEGVPLHRLAITAPNLESYLPELRRIWQELLGTAVTESGGRYNFSLGPSLAETPLFQAALLPLTFMVSGEQRQDFIGWLRSPFYGILRRHEQTILHWDVNWRKNGAANGWETLERGRTENGKPEIDAAAWALLDKAYSFLPAGTAPASVWRRRLLDIWKMLEFPHRLDHNESGQWQACLDLLQEFAAGGANLAWTAADLVEWLSWMAARRDLASDGSIEAGIQIQGLLELRGLDFEQIFCLGLNMGVFPPAPRHLPLLTGRERALVLGGDYQSQQEFAATSYRYLLAAAPNLILTRPLVDQEEEQVASTIIPATIWEEESTKFAALSRVHPAWLRSPAVRAAFRPSFPGPEVEGLDLVTWPLPDQISLSDLETALACPCRFFLNVLLGLEELREVEPGLPPSERGNIIHEILQKFTRGFWTSLQARGSWDDSSAWQYLREVVTEYQTRGDDNPYWEAEIARWLEEPWGLLREWLSREKQRYEEGWLWLAMEASFAGLQIPGWPTAVKGRLDRVDRHPTQGLMLWDYKTGDIPKPKEIIEDQDRFQLLGYLMALEQNLTEVRPQPETRAGIIGLKSSRDEHLKFEDYKLSSADWQELRQTKLAVIARRGKRVGEGDYRPDPSLPPPGSKNSCQYCPFHLLCGYRPATTGEEEE
jgi:RecB family exonuclease